MFSPISTISPIKSKGKAFTCSTAPIQSTTCSLQSLNPCNPLWTLLQWLFSFCCCCFKRSSQDKDIPRISPNALSRRDAFCKEVFSFDPSGKYHFQSEEGHKKTTEVFQILGTGNPLSWGYHTLFLQRRKRELIRLKLHPLTFLYFLFYNKKRANQIEHFKKKAPQWAWKEFINEQASNLAKQKDIAQKLPGFCKALGLKTAPFSQLTKAQKWDEFILFALEKISK